MLFPLASWATMLLAPSPVSVTLAVHAPEGSTVVVPIWVVTPLWVSSNVTVVPANAVPAVPVIVTTGKLVVPPPLVIATGVSDVTGPVKTVDVISDDEVEGADETLLAILELIVSPAGTKLPAT